MRDRRCRPLGARAAWILLWAMAAWPFLLPFARHLDGSWPGTATAFAGVGSESIAFWRAAWPWYPLAILVMAGLWLHWRRPGAGMGSSRTVLTVRLLLFALSAAGLLAAVPRLAALTELVVATPILAPPADEKAFRDTLLAELGRAVAETSPDVEIVAALERKDIAHARAHVQAARLLGIALAPATETAFAAATGWPTTIARGSWEALQGAVTGESRSLSGFVGALAGDLTPYGDLRDIAWQLAVEDEPDELILGLSVLGLAVTATGFVLPAQALPLQAGKAALKTSIRFAKAGTGVVADLRRLTRTTVDLPAFEAAARNLEMTPELAARFVRRQGVDELRAVGGDLYTIGQAAGPATAMAVLEHADDLADLPFYKRVATSLGEGAEGAVSILGKSTKRGFRVYKATAATKRKLAGFGALLLSSSLGLLASLSSSLVRLLARRWLRAPAAARM